MRRFRSMVGPVAILLTALLVMAAGALSSGPADLSIPEIARALFGTDTARPETHAIIFSIRLPRVLLAILLGAALAGAGCALQGLFRNPLADPGLIGVSTGGALGAVIAIVGWGHLRPEWGSWILPIAAMMGSLAAAWLVFVLSHWQGRTDIGHLLLIGIAVNALGGALIGGVIYLASDDQLRQFTFWTMGRLDGATWPRLGGAAAFIVAALILIGRLSRALDALLLGEENARALGFDANRLSGRIVALSALSVGAAVSVGGNIVFIGLAGPHLVRIWLGPSHGRLLPCAMLMGALLLLGADWAARSLDPPNEIPLAVFTALLGAPLFLILLRQNRVDGHV